MNELALFAGAGGGILGGHLLGWRTVCAVEWEAYPASVLVARQNDKILPPFPIWDDVQTFDGKPWRGIVDVVSGGFPCQDISAAGGGAGITGARSSMWKQMARIIGEVQPRYAFVENSPMLTTRGLGVVIGDLSEMGYDTEWGVLGANDVGANHKRDRIWILAYTNSKSNAERRFDSAISEISGQRNIDQGGSRRNVDGILESSTDEEMDSKQRNFLSYTEHDRVGWGEQQSERIKETDGTITNSSSNGLQEQTNKFLLESKRWDKLQFKQSRNTSKMANSNGIGQSRQRSHGKSISQETIRNRQTSVIGPICKSDFWSVEPNVGRVVDGMASRVDRLKAIGNGQVPLCAATAWNILKGRIDGRS